MLILALDTTSQWGGAGIFRDTECLATIPHQGPPDYSVSLFQDVDDLLERAGVSLSDIDLLAAANGPGSFTGIRVGLAAAQGWADALKKPWRGVSILEAMTEAAETRFALPVLDARRGEFYAGWFECALPGRETAEKPSAPRAAFRFVLSGEGALLKPERVAPFLEAHLESGATEQVQVAQAESCTVIAREDDVAASALQRIIPPSFKWKTITSFLVPSIARLAFLAALEGRPALPQEVTACYIRRTDAELHLNG
ncbi:MAG: tRNA (adenosine(37)-N6)-threonylcarbamoyltransferase complex dimerization subunit type 1 TsaB [Terriglobia bacterium]